MQTLRKQNIPLTLSRVVVSPSATRIYIKGDHLIAQSGASTSPGSAFSLKAGEQPVLTGNTGTTVLPPSSPTDDTIIEYDTSFYNQQGEWTFTIAPSGVQGATQPYVFHFSVPSQQ